jgi:hypothetical protein
LYSCALELFSSVCGAWVLVDAVDFVLDGGFDTAGYRRGPLGAKRQIFDGGSFVYQQHGRHTDILALGA